MSIFQRSIPLQWTGYGCFSFDVRFLFLKEILNEYTYPTDKTAQSHKEMATTDDDLIRTMTEYRKVN